MMIAETERLTLREFTANDTDFIIRLLNTEGWLRNIGNRHVNSKEQAVEFIERRLQPSYTDNGFGFYIVESKSTKECLGMCGLVKRDGLDNVDVGYAFLPEHFGKGYAYESTNRVVQFAKEKVGLKILDAITIAENASSIKLLEKLGFHFERNIVLNEEELMLYRKVL